ncbi:DNA-binding CsgD family transcriptional regulator [Saccharothrix tamanrassetensis]|uniref:DNA-binding CsgD family transcriptional regulator n=1 Tax=Saccharothrix tamanrassetensis TaxID=1051531 RepID=A0A841CTY1_9PSEU|nr:helix-turn-helix transcriptional regulator [Saccharothrix tamanrassetensis]MBB5959774.1 DNA-binding CsgD family transcriptional regulator [Saccharothrix tamanrassetensis]
MTRWGERLRWGLSEAAGQGADRHTIAEMLSTAITPWVPHDGVRLSGISPPSTPGPGALGYWHGYPSAMVQALRCEQNDSARPLAAAQPPIRLGPPAVFRQAPRREDAGTLSDEHDVGGELRLPLRNARGVWGTLGLLRAKGRPPFDAADADRAASLVPALVEGLRAFVTAGPLAPDAPALPTGLVVFGPDNTAVSATDQALAWQEQLKRRRCNTDMTQDPWFAGGLVTQARRHAQDPGTPPAVFCVPAVEQGRWTVLRAEALHGDGYADHVAFFVEAAGAQLLPSFCDWYGISRREQQVVAELCDGAPPRSIARRLGLSAHTVNDHLKAVYRKTCASGRDELVAAITT